MDMQFLGGILFICLLFVLVICERCFLARKCKDCVHSQAHKTVSNYPYLYCTRFRENLAEDCCKVCGHYKR